MARQINKLTTLKVKSLKAPGRYGDGDGLYLYVSKTGSRSWVFRYRDRTTGKHRDKGLGPVRDVSLEQAREEAKAARVALRSGSDPIDAPRELREQAALDRNRSLLFSACSTQYIDAHKLSWRNDKHAAQWVSTLSTYAHALAPLPVAEIDTPAVLGVLEPIWTTKTETATRVRQRIEAVLDWAAARGFRSQENPARWRGHLDKLLPKPAKVSRVTPRAALPYVEIAAFMRLLRGKAGLAPRALELQILVAARPSEVTGARWEEFDLDGACWTVPGDRMKAGKSHRIPLSPGALVLLRSLPQSGSHLFPGSGKNVTMTTAAPLKVLKELRPGVVAHGFRSTFRDWAADMTAYPREIAEQALAHSLADKTEAAYRRSDLFAKRAKMMSDWAAFIDAPPAVRKITLIHRENVRKA